jgi:arginyl-tRNA synthetase
VKSLEESEVLKRLSLIQYHQRLIVDMLEKSDEHFYKLIIKRGLTEAEVHEIFYLCEKLNIELEEQKAEGFVYYHPLYQQFLENLNKNLVADEVIKACISQKLYLELMNELQKYI